MRYIHYTAALWFTIGAIALGLVASPAAAQDDGGQFCVRSYEDTNANGIFDTESERLITRGVSVELLEASGVVISSALLDQSPNASLGLICFYNLSSGEYTVLMSSADYVATTQRLVTESVDSTAPTIIEFGGRRVANADGTRAGPGDTSLLAQLTSPTRTQILVAAVGTVVVMLLLAIGGIVIYALTSRRRRSVRPVTYSQDAVRALDTEEYVPPPSAETEPPVTDEDTNPTVS